MIRGSQLLRVLISILWCVASVALGVGSCMIGGWVFNTIAVLCALSAVISGYITREELKYL